ncbi:MAG: hypothetical protein WBW88_06390 [Rhodothermales bacterium]
MTGDKDEPAPPFPACPVVLMHGFGAFLHLLASISLTPLIKTLRDRGVTIYAPKVEPYSPVPVRVRAWKERIRDILSDTGAKRVHLVAYSSGGLDARYLITREGGSEFVTSLTTISTPHRGSTVALAVLKQPDLIRKGLTGLADWMGRRIYASPSEAEHALEQLTPAYIETNFNPIVPDHPDVRYASWAGQAGLGTDVPINPLLKITNRLLFEAEGVNDGIVSVGSAEWTGFEGVLDADHGRQIGIKAWNGAFEPEPFILKLVGGLGD